MLACDFRGMLEFLATEPQLLPGRIYSSIAILCAHPFIEGANNSQNLNLDLWIPEWMSRITNPISSLRLVMAR